FDANAISEPQGRNITRLRQRSAESNRAFELLVVVVWRVGGRARFKRDGRIENRVVGTSALINDRGIHIRLEGRAHLAQGLRRAIKFRFVEVPAADHGFDLAGRVIHRHQRPLCPRILFQADAHRPVRGHAENLYVANIATLQDVLNLLLWPGSILLADGGEIAARFDARPAETYARNEGMHVAVTLRLIFPIGMFVMVQGDVVGKNVFEMPLPSMAAL